MFLFLCLPATAQETKTYWGMVEALTIPAELPSARVVHPGVPYFVLDVTGGASWKQGLRFQHNTVTQLEIGVDYAADGTNRFYIYGGSVAYVSKWPSIQGAASSCLRNDGAGDLTWVACGGANLWSQAGGVLSPTTPTDHVQIGGGATTSELRLMEQSGNGANYSGFKAPAALAANVVYELPAADGSGGECLSTSGAKVLSWTACSPTASGWTDDGAVVRLTTATDRVAIGAATLAETTSSLEVSNVISNFVGMSLSGPSTSGKGILFRDSTSAERWLLQHDTHANANDFAFWFDPGTTTWHQNLRLHTWTTTYNTLIVGTGLSGGICCGEALALQGSADSHLNVTLGLYRQSSTTLGGAISIVGTTPGDWVNSSVQNDMVMRGQSTIYLSSGAAGMKGYKLTETTHDWYVSDTGQMSLTASEFRITKAGTMVLGMNHTGEAGFKSTFAFRDDGTAKSEFGIDIANNGTNQLYWYNNADSVVMAYMWNGGFQIGGGTGAAEFRILEASGSGTNYTGFKAQAMAADVMYTLPAADGSLNQVLTTNGAKVLSWSSATTHPDPHQLGAGSAGTPTYSFSGDPNTGMYSDSGDVLGFSAAGTRIFRMGYDGGQPVFAGFSNADTAAGNWSNSTRIVAWDSVITDLQPLELRVYQVGAYTGISGTATAPFYTWEDDPNTGMFLPSEGRLGLVATNNTGYTGSAQFEMEAPDTYDANWYFYNGSASGASDHYFYFYSANDGSLDVQNWHVTALNLIFETASSYVELYGTSAPTVAPANKARLYVGNNGSKDQLCVIFSSGAAQCFATQP